MTDKKYATLFVNDDVGKKIKNARERKGLSQKVLADRSLVNVKKIGEIENGKKKPTLEDINDLAEVLEVDARSFLMPPMDEFMKTKLKNAEKDLRGKLAQLEEEIKKARTQEDEKLKEMHELVDIIFTKLNF